MCTDQTPLTQQRLEKFQHVIGQRQPGLTLVLEDVSDPHNAEAVFRSCDAFGIQDVHIIFDQQKSFNPKKMGRSTSSSANKWLDFHRYESSKICFEFLKSQGYLLAATVISPNSSPIFSCRFDQKKIAVILGNEHTGLSETAVKMADHCVTIPMLGMVESLNLSVTAAIFLFEMTRQRQQSCRYSEAEQKLLLDSFIQRS